MSLKWREGNIYGSLDKRPICGGVDSDGSQIFVGRALHDGVYMPAKIMPEKQQAYICYGGVEIPVENFEYLSGRERYFSWVPASDGNIVDGAVWTGDDNGEMLYVGRAAHENSLTIGKIHPSHSCIYIPYGGGEIGISQYEVLVYRNDDSDSD